MNEETVEEAPVITGVDLAYKDDRTCVFFSTPTGFNYFYVKHMEERKIIEQLGGWQ